MRQAIVDGVYILQTRPLAFHDVHHKRFSSLQHSRQWSASSQFIFTPFNSGQIFRFLCVDEEVGR